MGRCLGTGNRCRRILGKEGSIEGEIGIFGREERSGRRWPLGNTSVHGAGYLTLANCDCGKATWIRATDSLEAFEGEGEGGGIAPFLNVSGEMRSFHLRS